MPSPSGATGLQAEDQLERLVDRALLSGPQASHALVEPIEVDGAQLLDEDARVDSPPTWISGRNLVGAALRDVGAMIAAASATLAHQHGQTALGRLVEPGANDT